MGIQTQSALIAAILLLAIGINVFFQPRPVVYRYSFVAFVGALFLYNLAFFLHGVAEPGSAWGRVLVVSGAVVAQLGLRFYERFLGDENATARLVSILATLLTAVLVLTRLGTSGLLGGVVACYALGVFGYCTWRLYVRYRDAESDVEALRLMYLVIGGAVAVTFSGLDLLPLLGVPFPSLGHLLATLYMYFWMQIIQRSRMLDLEELLGRGLTLLIQAVAVALIYTGLVVWVGGRLGLFFFNTMLASVVLMFLFEPLKQVVESWIGRLLFREKFELELQLGRLRRELANVIDLKDLVEKLLHRLEVSHRVTHASVFLLESDGRGYFTPRTIGPVAARRVDVVKGRAFLDALRQDKVLTLEQVEREIADLGPDTTGTPEVQRLEALRETMDEISAGLSFAFLSGERLLGFLNVKDERVREPFSSFEIRLIAGVAAQATVTIENSALVERLKERDRLSVLGEMAAGLAHEIRNPLGAIKAAGQLLEPENLDEEQREMVDVIIEEVDRLNGVLSQFLDYARPYRGALGPVAVVPMLERVATLIRPAAREAGIEVRLELPVSPPPPVLADAQLEQVFLNLARNACDAMAEGGGTLTIGAEQVPEGPAGGGAAVDVRFADTGPGIPEEVQRNLFIPFYTTKPRGTGLGLAISQRIMQHHGGAIRVSSQPGRGTTMTVRLRRADEPLRVTGEHRRPAA